MTTKYFALLTNQGAAKLANAAAQGTQLKITEMALGDGGGSLPTPDPAQTKLISEKRRAALNTLKTDTANSNHIIAEQIIPEDEGGFWIREIALYDDDGTMVAVANCAETYKPKLQEGSGRTQTVRMILIVNSPSSVTLKIDPSVVLATRQYVDDKTIEVKGYTDDVMKKHVEAANPHPQYLQTANALAEIKNAGLMAEARKNLELGSAALSEIQTSKDDVTAGRALVNGGAIAVRTVSARGEGDSAYKDTNDLSANAVSFVYSSAKNSPGFEASLLDFSGHTGNYRVQLAASYANGNHFKVRTMNGDNQTWNDWYELYHTNNKPTARDIDAVPVAGGTMTGELSTTSLNSYRIRTDNKAFFLRFDGNDFYILKTVNGDPDGLWDNSRPLRINANDGRLYLGANTRIEGNFYAQDACFQTDGNLYGSAWGGWLSDWLNSQLAAIRNAASDAQANRVTDIRLTAEHQVGANGITDYRNANTVLTGFTNGDADYSAEGLFWSYIQYYRSGQWITVGRS